MKLRSVIVITSILVLAGIVTWAFAIQPVKAASGPIYIKADGSIDPSTANITSLDNITYTLTGNINDSIVVQRTNITIDGNGYTVKGPGSVMYYAGVHIEYVSSSVSDNVTVKNVTITGFGVGISLVSTEGNKILGNTITNNTNGIAFGEAWNNTISGNIITNNTNGFGGSTVADTVFSGNIIANNTVGIYFSWAQDNVLYLNNITNNGYGIYMEGVSVYNNTFYHNNFINNMNHVYIDPDNPNVWDDGYPSGGNYWDNFTERYPSVGDVYSGPGQNITGSDGIWDGPYEINVNNTDRYPLTNVIPEFPTLTSIVPIFVVFTVALAVYKRKLAKTPIR